MYIRYNKMVNTQLVGYREREQSSIVTQTNNQLNVALSQLQRGSGYELSHRPIAS